MNSQSWDLRRTATKARNAQMGYDIPGRLDRAADRIEELERENDQLKAELTRYQDAVLRDMDYQRDQRRWSSVERSHEAEAPNHGGY